MALGCYDRLFLKHVNKGFGDHLELAFRAALFLFIIGTPFVLERGTSSFVDAIKDSGWFTAGVSIFFIFTFNFTTGQTICGACSGILGSLFATIYMWVLFGFIPSGVTHDTGSHVLAIGIFNGVFFVMFLLFLNFDPLLRIFALCTFLGLWMMFMDPADDAFSKGFTLSAKGAPVAGFIVAIVGVTSAVMVSMVPFPFWAMDKARASARGIAKELCETWTAVIGFYCADAKLPYETSQVLKNMRELADEVAGLSGHIGNGWWECFQMGSWQKARLMMKRMNAAATENYDRLTSCLAVCMLESFEPGSQHMTLMAKMKPALMKVVKESKDVFQICAEIAAKGSMADAHKTELEANIKEIKDAIVAATKAFQDAKKELGITGISLDMNDEHAFCLSVCAFGRLTMDFAQALVDDKTGTKPIPSPYEGRGVTGIFDPNVIFEWKWANLATRGSLSILLGFYIGYFGYYSVVPKNNAAISITCVFMMSSSVSASLTKNLGSVQGVVLGSVVGRLVWSLTGWCTWWGYIALCLSLFLWNFLTLYIRFDSTVYGGLGLLLAAFGSGNFLLGCIPDGSTFDTAPAYFSIINVIVAIFIVIFVDLALSPGRASKFATEAWRDAVKNFRMSLHELLDSSEPNVRVKSGALGGLIGNAKSLGAEAWEEPRFWRTPWLNALFNKACQTLVDLRVTMTAMEYSVTEGGAGGTKTEIFMKLLAMPQFTKIQDTLKAKLDLLDALYGIFELETSDPLTAETHEGREYSVFDDPRLQRDYKAEMQEDIKGVMEDLNKAIEEKEVDTLENDEASQVSFCLSAFLMMMDQLDSLQQAIIQA